MPFRRSNPAFQAVSMGFPLLASLTMVSPARAQVQGLSTLEVHNAKSERVTYRGREAVRLVPAAGQQTAASHAMASITGRDFREGTIELDVAGAVLPGASDGARGFIGIAFHVQQDVNRFKAFYIRPTNGRADDQLRRNHSTQYISQPDFPWHRLRKEEPGRYESYVDLEPGVWTRLRVVVRGTRAELFVNGAVQPTLIVTDLKANEASGGLALWIGAGTEGYFSNFQVR